MRMEEDTTKAMFVYPILLVWSTLWLQKVSNLSRFHSLRIRPLLECKGHAHGDRRTSLDASWLNARSVNVLARATWRMASLGRSNARTILTMRELAAVYEWRLIIL